MASPAQKPTHRLLSGLLNKGRRLFRNTSAPIPSDLQIPSPAASSGSQTKFKKGNDARHDISVLAMSYILQDNPTIQELIRLIIDVHDRDDGRVCNPRSMTCGLRLSIIFLALWSPGFVRRICNSTRSLPRGRLYQRTDRYHDFSDVGRYFTVSLAPINYFLLDRLGPCERSMRWYEAVPKPRIRWMKRWMILLHRSGYLLYVYIFHILTLKII
jgi:hypothetical protein